MNKIFQVILSFIIIIVFMLTASYSQNRFDTPPDGYFFIKSVQAENQNLGYWDQPGVPEKYERGANLALYAKDNNIDQQYRFINAGNGYYYIESKNGGVVDIDGGKKENNTNVQVWSGHGASNQLFRFKLLGEGRWKIYTFSGRVVSTPQNFSNGSNVHMWEDHDGAWTEWYFENAKTGETDSPK